VKDVVARSDSFDSSAEVGEMGPKRKVVTQFALACLTALALSASAEAAVFYGAGGSGLTSLSATSDAIDLGGVFSSFTIDATLGLTISSEGGTTLTAGSEELQVVQGCLFAAGSCAGLWFDIVGKGTSLGGASFTETTPPLTQVVSFDTGLGGVLVTGTPVQSLRLAFNVDPISPSASVGATGSLSVVAIPEPQTWALLLAGILGIAGIARRRIG